MSVVTIAGREIALRPPAATEVLAKTGLSVGELREMLEKGGSPALILTALALVAADGLDGTDPTSFWDFRAIADAIAPLFEEEKPADV